MDSVYIICTVMCARRVCGVIREEEYKNGREYEVTGWSYQRKCRISLTWRARGKCEEYVKEEAVCLHAQVS